MAIFFAVTAEASGPKRVLVLHSFARDIAPYDTVASLFRTELAQRYAGPISFVEANLDSGRASTDREEVALVEFLRARFEDAPPDVVATLGGPAALFLNRHRAESFGAAPVIMGSVDERNLKRIERRANDVAAAVDVEIPKLIDNILRLLPDTETIAVVGGTSALERFWLRELKGEVAPFASRVKFEWLDDLTLAQIRQRLATLPPRSAVFYSLFVVDAAGVPYERQEVLASLRAVTTAPIFGVFESEIGSGVVGGPNASQRRNAERMAEAAAAALNGTGSPGPRVHVDALEPPIYDWRELRRWNIDAARLPPGSEIRFKAPSLWQEHGTAIVATAAVVLFQGLLITALLGQRFRRQHAEREARHLGGRILTAQEEERRRIAREMHDDVSQRLAALAIDAAEAKNSAGSNGLDTIRERLLELGEDVHALSYRLHPSVIDDLGLVAALKVECNRVASQEPLQVNFSSASIPRDVDASAALCLFRVAQEALRNVVRHANASNVDVSLEGKEGGLVLAVRDDGKGFDDARDDVRPSLGLVSMRERVRLVGGKVDIVTRPDEGTSIVAWVPLGEAA